MQSNYQKLMLVDSYSDGCRALFLSNQKYVKYGILRFVDTEGDTSSVN